MGVSAARQPVRVLCLMDLSVYGRAGLAVAAPALAACGAQACPLPAALFSTHTGCFGAVQKRDEAAFGEAAVTHFTGQGVVFDAVYIGYLYSEAQFALAHRILDAWPEAFAVVDPALGDDGHLYGGMPRQAVEWMAGLCARANLITPNYTESALLCGEDPAAPAAPGAAEKRLRALAGGGASVLITSAPAGQGYQTLGLQAGASHGCFTVLSNHLPAHYPGSGDLYTAAVAGLVLARGLPLETAARQAARFVEAAVRATWQAGGQPRLGLWFEPFLPMLSAARGPGGEGDAG